MKSGRGQVERKAGRNSRSWDRKTDRQGNRKHSRRWVEVNKVRRKNEMWADGVGTRVSDRKTNGRQHALGAVLWRLLELFETQVDPILGLQHESWYGDWDPGGIWQQLKAEQGQGHGHLQFIHGKLFPNAVPCSSWEGQEWVAVSGRLWCKSIRVKHLWIWPHSWVVMKAIEGEHDCDTFG